MRRLKRGKRTKASKESSGGRIAGLGSLGCGFYVEDDWQVWYSKLYTASVLWFETAALRLHV